MGTLRHEDGGAEPRTTPARDWTLRWTWPSRYDPDACSDADILAIEGMPPYARFTMLVAANPRPYASWQMGEEYYVGGALMWLDVDAKIRALTHDKSSLDTFAREFYSKDNGSYVTKTYTFAQLVAAVEQGGAVRLGQFSAQLARCAPAAAGRNCRIRLEGCLHRQAQRVRAADGRRWCAVFYSYGVSVTGALCPRHGTEASQGKWCARRDSNPRPLPSEGNTLSS